MSTEGETKTAVTETKTPGKWNQRSYISSGVTLWGDRGPQPLFDASLKKISFLEPMSKTSSTSSGETKQDDTQLHFLGSVLIPSATTKEDLNSTDLVPIQQVPLAPQQQQYYPPQQNIPIAQPIALK